MLLLYRFEMYKYSKMLRKIDVLAKNKGVFKLPYNLKW